MSTAAETSNTTTTTAAGSPRSFVDALGERYGATDSPAQYDFNVGNPNSRRRNKTWEMVGMEDMTKKQSDHSRIAVLGLQGCNIRIAEQSAGQIRAAKLSRVRELDLSDNAALEAAEVDTIVAALPSLVELQLSGTAVGNVKSWSPSQADLHLLAVAPAPAAAAPHDDDDNNNNEEEDGASGSGDNDAAAATVNSLASTTNNNKNNIVVAPLSSKLIGSAMSLGSSTSDLSSMPSSPFRSTSWARLQTLALNRCGMSWAALLDAFPATLGSLTSLHCESNNIDRVFRAPTAENNNGEQQQQRPPLFPALKEINLSFNRLSCSLDDAEMAAFFVHETPKLASVNFTGNKMTLPVAVATAPGAASDSSVFLGQLQTLIVTNNSPLVTKTRANNNDQEEPLLALEWLRTTCGKLKYLRMSYDDVFGISVNDAGSEKAQKLQEELQRPMSHLSEVQQRSLVIAAVSQLDSLNSGTVRPKEKMDAEMLYLQVAKAKAKLFQQQQEAAAAATSDSPSPAAAATTTSATQRFFPWRHFPLLGLLEEKHKNVVLSSLNGEKGGQQTTGVGAALNYTLTLTFRLLAKDADHDESNDGSSSASTANEGNTMSQRRERAKRINATALADDVTRTVPGNMTVGKLRSFVASVFPQLAPVARQKKLQAYPSDSVVPPTVLEKVDDEQPLLLCGVPSSAILEVFV